MRQLERIIRKLCSKAARCFVEENRIITFTKESLEKYLVLVNFIEDESIKEDQIGITNGLAWTAYGGEMIKIEAVLCRVKENCCLTGQLGDVMKESAQAALSYARATCSRIWHRI